MKTTQEKDKATARPWRIEDFALAGANIKSCEAAPRTIAALQRPFPNLMDAEENKANAELIVQAVNEHAALNAVAKQVQLSLDVAEGEHKELGEHLAVGCPYCSLKSTLANLAALRKG